MNKERIQYIILITLLLVIICLFYNKNINIIETFACSDTSTNKDLEDCLNDEISNLQTSRQDLKTALEKEPDKANYKKQYYGIIEDTLKEKLQYNKDKLDDHNTDAIVKLKNLRDNIKYINTLLNFKIETEEYNSIKSLQNGSKIAIYPIKDDSYLIKMNTSLFESGYLTVDENNNISITPLKKTQNGYDITQQFEIKQIKNKANYEENLDKGLLINQLYDNTNIVYPFSLIISKYNKNCLQLFNNNVSLMSCKPYKSHRFQPSKEKILCEKGDKIFI
jgi:hypothetical protein